MFNHLTKSYPLCQHVTQAFPLTARCECTGHYFIWQISFIIYCASRVGGRRSGLRQTANKVDPRMGQNISIFSIASSIQFPTSSVPDTLSPRIKRLGREANQSINQSINHLHLVKKLGSTVTKCPPAAHRHDTHRGNFNP